MKKIIPIFLVGVLVLSGLGAVAIPETKEDVVIEETESISLSEPILIEDSKYISVRLEEATSFLMKSGEPVLPKITKVYTLPVGSNIKDVSVEFFNVKKQVISKEVRPAPEPIIEGKDVKRTEVKSEEVYSSSEVYPATSYYY